MKKAILGLIPARGGSVRLPKKNMRDLNGLPLIGWTIAAARMAHQLTHVAVTTDDVATLEFAIDMNTLPIDRPDHLSRGDQPMQLSVVRHALEELSLYRALRFDAVCLLQPTSPLRTADDIDRAITILQDLKADSVVSVTDIADENASFQIRHAGRMERIPDVVVPNGAIFIATTKHLAVGGNWFDGECYAYKMSKDQSLDIDTEQDLEFARIAMEKNNAPPRL